MLHRRDYSSWLPLATHKFKVLHFDFYSSSVFGWREERGGGGNLIWIIFNREKERGVKGFGEIRYPHQNPSFLIPSNWGNLKEGIFHEIVSLHNFPILEGNRFSYIMIFK